MTVVGRRLGYGDGLPHAAPVAVAVGQVAPRRRAAAARLPRAAAGRAGPRLTGTAAAVSHGHGFADLSAWRWCLVLKLKAALCALPDFRAVGLQHSINIWKFPSISAIRIAQDDRIFVVFLINEASGALLRHQALIGDSIIFDLASFLCPPFFLEV